MMAKWREFMAVAGALSFCGMGIADEKPEPGAEKRDGAIEVYRTDLSKRLELDVWSKSNTFKAPVDGRNFLGEYGGQTSVVMSLKDLPKHKFIRLRCRIVLHKSADGNGGGKPDLLSIMVDGGAALSLFSLGNPRPGDDPGKQSYPDEWPFGNHPSGTGTERPELGFEDAEEGAVEIVCPVDVTFPHTEADIAIKFYSSFRDRWSNEAWGIEEVIVDAISEAATFSPDEIADLWKQLRDKDPVIADRALWKIVAGGMPAVEAVMGHYRPYAAEVREELMGKLKLERERFENILKGLESDDFAERQESKGATLDLDPEYLPLVEEALARGDIGLETRVALVELKDRLDSEVWNPEVKSHSDLVGSRLERILRIYRTVENGYRVTLSHPKKPGGIDCLGAPADGLVPLNSVGSGFPRLTWHPTMGEPGWLQYDFPKKKTINSAQVFWYQAGKCQLPVSWKVQYQDEGGAWKDVKAKGIYGRQHNRWNRIRFDSVETVAVRLAVEMAEDHTVGVYEFQVENKD